MRFGFSNLNAWTPFTLSLMLGTFSFVPAFAAKNVDTVSVPVDHLEVTYNVTAIEVPSMPPALSGKLNLEVLRSGFGQDPKVLLNFYNSLCRKAWPKDGEYWSDRSATPHEFALFAPIDEYGNSIPGFHASVLLDPENPTKPMHPETFLEIPLVVRNRLLTVTVEGATWVGNLMQTKTIECSHSPAPTPVSSKSPDRKKETPLEEKGRIFLQSGTEQRWTTPLGKLPAIIIETPWDHTKEKYHETFPKEWHQPLPGTHWVNRDGDPFNKKKLKIKHCFLSHHATSAQLKLKYYVDDVASLSFNNETVIVRMGPGHDIDSHLNLKAGENCLEFTAEDTGDYYLGIDFSGVIESADSNLTDLNF